MPPAQPALLIRPATAADAPAISDIHVSNVESWVELGEDGIERPARYSQLTAYQRWLNGGPWMDAALCAHHIQRQLECGALLLVAELRGRVLAEAALYMADEPGPFGRNMNLSTLYVHRNHQRLGIGSALLRHTLALAQANGCDTFLVSNAESPLFYLKHGLQFLFSYGRYRFSARASKTPYAAEPLPDGPYDLVRGCAMPMGRYQNAHDGWERTRPGATPDLPAWGRLRAERWWITASGVRSALILEESPRHEGAAEAFLFSRASLTEPLIAAVRDRAFRSQFTHLCALIAQPFKHSDAIPLDYAQQLFIKRL